MTNPNPRRNNNRRYNNRGRRNNNRGKGVFDGENISPQQRRVFSNKRDQHINKGKELLAAGDRVEAENHFQHAEHFFRMMNLGQTNKPKSNSENKAEGEEATETEETTEATESAGTADKTEEQTEKPAEEPASDIGDLPFMQN